MDVAPDPNHERVEPLVSNHSSDVCENGGSGSGTIFFSRKVEEHSSQLSLSSKSKSKVKQNQVKSSKVN